jgi:methylmalonyl-CoA mutase cobalamin-binding subunit
MESQPLPTLNIAAVERETGLSKDVLRKWEMRYGFPAPLRDSLGERAYPADQVNRLRLIKRLMDAGMRPSRVVNVDAEGLIALARAREVGRPGENRVDVAARSLGMLRKRDPGALRQHLQRELLRHGMEQFVLDTLVPLSHAVGEAWARGELDIHEEHVYTEVVQGLLRSTTASLNHAAGSPRMLLTTLPEEQHGLGLLMAAALFSLRGAACISLGTQTPVQEIARAARVHNVDVVALSFSNAYPRRRIQPALDELRQQIGDAIEIWAGGAGSARMPASAIGARFLPTLELAQEALSTWQAAHLHG